MTADSHKLWGGRFAAPTAHALDALNRSIGTDFRLWPFDVQLSQAWASALAEAGVLTEEERDQIRGGLDAVAEKIVSGAKPEESDEDVHTMIDRMLHTEIGAPASRLHTGRSRNDQVATATRMWTMDAATRIDAVIRDLQHVILDHAEQLRTTLIPAYTHMQRAQPVSAAHWILSHFWQLERDRARVANAAASASSLPLGSGLNSASARYRRTPSMPRAIVISSPTCCTQAPCSVYTYRASAKISSCMGPANSDSSPSAIRLRRDPA